MYDIIIIGSGPGGYSAAIEALKSNMSTVVIEDDLIGGTCVNHGCIPTKPLLKYAKLLSSGQNVTYELAAEKSVEITVSRRLGLTEEIRQLGGTIISGHAKLVSSSAVSVNGEIIEGKNIIIASGSHARQLPIAKYDETDIVTTKGALKFMTVPSSVVVVGSGATGIELASVWAKFGADVTVLEMLPNIMGNDEPSFTEMAKAHFAKDGMKVFTEVAVRGVVKNDEGVLTTYEDKDGVSHTITSEKVLIAAGVVPNSEGLGLEDAGVETERGYIKVNDCFQTNIPNIFAVGDVNGKLALAFAASLQAKKVIAFIRGEKPEPVDHNMIPRCIFSSIEAGYAGMNERSAAAAGIETKKDVLPYRSFNGNYVGESQGMMKILSDKASGKVLGITLFGVDAADLIAGPARLISQGITAPELINSINGGVK